MGQNRNPYRSSASLMARSALPAIGVLSSATVALAELPTMEWHAPPGCGTAAELMLGVSRLLRAHTSDVVHERFVATVVEQTEGRWSLVLQASSRSSNWTRTLTGATCRELRDAAKVMIALAIEPSRADASVGQSDASAADGVPAATPIGDTPTANLPASGAPLALNPLPATSPSLPSGGARMEGATSPPNGSASQLVSPGRLPANSALTPGTPVSGATGGVVPPKAREGVPSPNTASALGSPPLSGSALFAQTGIAVGVLPAPTPVAALGAMHGVNHLQYSGALGWAFAQTSHSSKDPSKGARVRLGFAAMQVGYAWLERSLELGVHTSALAGVMAAVSTGVDNRQSGLGPYAALGMGLSVALSRWAALFTVDGWMSYLSPDFQVADLGRVYQPGPFGGILGVGLRGRLK